MSRVVNCKKGFTLIEVIVVIAVVAILAAMLTPSIIKHIEDARISTVQNDVSVIGASMTNMYKDVGRWPIDSTPQVTGNNLYVMETESGTAAGYNGAGTTGWTTWGAAYRATFEDHLIYNDPDEDDANGEVADDYPVAPSSYPWKGPYLVSYGADPWGNKFYCNVIGFWYSSSYESVFVLSAGADGSVNTDVSQMVTDPPTVGGDDIVFRLK